MSPHEKLIQIHIMTEHAMANPTPCHTMAKVEQLIKENEASVDFETPVMRYVPPPIMSTEIAEALIGGETLARLNEIVNSPSYANLLARQPAQEQYYVPASIAMPLTPEAKGNELAGGQIYGAPASLDAHFQAGLARGATLGKGPFPGVNEVNGGWPTSGATL